MAWWIASSLFLPVCWWSAVYIDERDHGAAAAARVRAVGRPRRKCGPGGHRRPNGPLGPPGVSDILGALWYGVTGLIAFVLLLLALALRCGLDPAPLTTEPVTGPR